MEEATYGFIVNGGGEHEPYIRVSCAFGSAEQLSTVDPGDESGFDHGGVVLLQHENPERVTRGMWQMSTAARSVEEVARGHLELEVLGSQVSM